MIGFICYLVGSLLAFGIFIWSCVKEEKKITLQDIGIAVGTGLFSWIALIVGAIVFGDKIVLWKKKEE